MAQPTFPGVYIREAPSGVRTITGVATSIAAFVGMAKSGPVNEPTRVFGFTDYTRIFTDDTSLGEMTSQVRQFFLNGGAQAFIVRVARNSLASVSQLADRTGTAVLDVEALFDGDLGDQIHLSVDYDTPNPEKTFNLRVFREVLNDSGQPQVLEEENFADLTMDSASPRFVVSVLENESGLVRATLVGTPTAHDAFSASTTIFATAADAGNAIDAAVTASDPGRLRIRVGTGPLQTIEIPAASLSTGAAVLGEVQALVNSQLLLPAGTVTVTAAATNGVIVFATTNDQDIEIQPGPTNDITAPLGLGLANGGLEVGRFANARPAPSGIVSIVTNEAASPAPTPLLALAPILKTDLNLFAVNPPPKGFSVSPLVFTSPGASFAHGAAAPGTSLLNVRENLQALASAINNTTTNWRATVVGYRLSIQPIFGASTAGATFTVNTETADLEAGGHIFDTALGAEARPAAVKLSGGLDGDPPKLNEYSATYERLRSDVDLFNILLLPFSTGELATDRASFWGPASVFAQEERAFLIVDAPKAADTVPLVEAAIVGLRAGVVTDHAAVYWPQVEIVEPDGTPRTVDPSGTIAGIMSRIDSSRGVWKAPAGLEAGLRGVLGVDVLMSDQENGILNPKAINAIRAFPSGIVAWGSRTMAGFDNSGNDDFKYVPVRRFTLFIEESLFRGLQFAVFEPNDEQLWAQIRLAVTGFMNTLFRQGAFAGKTARDAFFVKVDAETTTQNDINRGIVNVIVGFAPLKPAEFIIVTIRQQAGQVQV